ncbi:heme lyase CcmF/NrfE family subunit [Actibacterium sp.]|uniref:heme lyase CcmF/NrfE family subunit n=1 Tax=Actibacterium sp. TaxID=1872125 RepID=UPI0035665C34
MAAELGQFALILSLFVAILQSVLPIWGAHRGERHLMGFGTLSALVLALLLILAFGCLAYGFVTTDVSLRAVVMHSNSAMPLLFRFSGTWGNHEGSLLLWVLILALFGGALALGGRSMPATLKARVLAVQGMIATGFLALMVFTSNPFARVFPAPADGQELNPLLQDVGLAFHPPFLYLGYVGFSVTFAFAIAALIEGRIDAAWARYVRPWVLAAWCFLTIGITLGSYWAYYELGWGGWWFWDPVENASFMPWIVGTALLHSALVVERRQALVVWTVLLAILAFSLSIVGTFLVRSGLLTSVHAFATDPARGVGVLMILIAATGGGLTLFSMRAGRFNQPVLFSPISREGGLVLNNILLVTAAGTVFLGTFYPLIVEMMGPDKISVGAPYFNRTFVPIMVPLLLAVSVGGVLRWKRDNLGAALKRLRGPAVLAIAALVAVYVGTGFMHPFAAGGIGLSVWLVLGALIPLLQRLRLSEVPLRRSLILFLTTPRATLGMVAAHIGLGLAVAGITCVAAFDSEEIAAIAPGQALNIAGYEVTLDRVKRLRGDNYQAEQAQFTVTKGGMPFTSFSSERRFYPVSGRATTEAGIDAHLLTNLYVALGDPDDRGRWVVRLYHHPLALLIWIGPLVMAFGGLISLTDRRFRVGAPTRRRAAAMPAVPVAGE